MMSPSTHGFLALLRVFKKKYQSKAVGKMQDIYIYTYSKNPAHELPWVFHGFREKVSLCFKKKKLDDGNQLHNIKKIN